MTVGAAPRQSGLFDGTAAFRVDPGGREADLAGVAPGMSSAVPRGDVRRPGGATAFATVHSCLQDTSQTLGENLLTVLHQFFAQEPWPPPPPSARPERSPPNNYRYRRLPTCTADLKVSAPPGARNRACA